MKILFETRDTATWRQTHKLKSEKHTQFLWLQDLTQVSVSQGMALALVFTSAGGASEDLELFIRKRPHFLAFVKWSNRSCSQALCPLATVRTGNSKTLKMSESARSRQIELTGRRSQEGIGLSSKFFHHEKPVRVCV